jgi:hypothetical protein
LPAADRERRIPDGRRAGTRLSSRRRVAAAGCDASDEIAANVGILAHEAS